MVNLLMVPSTYFDVGERTDHSATDRKDRPDLEIDGNS